jgi:hypothetical protein
VRLSKDCSIKIKQIEIHYISLFLNTSVEEVNKILLLKTSDLLRGLRERKQGQLNFSKTCFIFNETKGIGISFSFQRSWRYKRDRTAGDIVCVCIGVKLNSKIKYFSCDDVNESINSSLEESIFGAR